MIYAYHRLIELRQKHVDPQILGVLVKAVSEDLPDNKGRGASKYREELLNLFGHVTSTVSLKVTCVSEVIFFVWNIIYLPLSLRTPWIVELGGCMRIWS